MRSRMICRVLGISSWSLNGLDRAIAQIINKKNGYYVELGANNGLDQSNTKLLEFYHSWHGVLIEPIPSKFNELRRNRSKKNSFANVACVSFSYEAGTIPMYYSNLMTVALKGDSELPNLNQHILDSIRYLPTSDKNYTFQATAQTLQQVLNGASAPKYIDLLSLDVEGGEFEVLNGIDHSNYRFGWILVESRNFERLTSYFASINYELFAVLSHHDYLFRNVETFK